MIYFTRKLRVDEQNNGFGYYMCFFFQCGENCARTCFSNDPDIECFVLDNHGYIIVSKYPEDTGKFLGEINGRLMQRLVSENIYEEVNVTDYQAVCDESINEGNPANILQTVSDLNICFQLKIIN